MNPSIIHDVTKAVRDAKLPLSEEEFDSIVEQALKAGAERISTASTGRLVLPEYPYLTISMCVGEIPHRLGSAPPQTSAIVGFVNRMRDEPVTHIAAYHNGYVVHAQTFMRELEPKDYGQFLQVLDLRCESPESVDSIMRLWLEHRSRTKTTTLQVPTDMVDHILEGRGTAIKVANEKNFSQLMELTSGDRSKQDIINGCSSACDGIMGEYERNLVRLSNEMPMMMQEARSYALNTVEELMKPFRDRQHASMSGWASW